MSRYGATNTATTVSSGSVTVMIVVLIVIGILAFVAWLWSINLFAAEAKRKGHGNTGVLWFMGIFATPIVVGLYTAQLPDLSQKGAEQHVEQEDFAVENA